ncbi:MAG: ATP-binding protein [Bacillota bacterium]|nr:ATP-binding protein [Bacillota bacterium]
MPYITRDIENKLKEAAKQFASITIYGPRQVGKSTVVKRLFHDVPSISMDNLELRNYALKDPSGFVRSLETPILIDEIQKAPELLEGIKEIIDKKKLEWLEQGEDVKLLYILSGSNQFELQEAISESLAGRTCVFNLSSLSYNEIVRRGSSAPFSPSIEVLQRKAANLGETRSRREIFSSIFLGGMPEYIDRSPDRDMFFSSYISTYLEKDVRKLVEADKITVFLDFMKYVALRSACQINFSEIARSIGIDARTVKSWLSILETSGIIKQITPYYKNLSDRITKANKLYFMDTGLCAYLCGIPSSEILERSAFAGAFYETYVVSEIIKSFYNGYKSADCIYYYRDKDQKEVDLVIEEFDSVYPIEIKKGVGSVSSKKNFSFLNKYGKKVNVGLVIDSSERLMRLNDEAYICPIDTIGL